MLRNCRFVLLLILLSSCSKQAAAPIRVENVRDTSVELSQYMAFLQRYTTKLGYSLRSKNVALSKYYLEEIEDTIGAIERDVTHFDGFEVGKLVPSHLKGPIGFLKDGLDKGSFDEGIDDSYRALINRCNACHQFTDRGFLVMEAPKGNSPFSQSFQWH